MEDLQKISVKHFPGIQVGLPKVELLLTFLQNFTTSWLYCQNVQITTIRDLTQTNYTLLKIKSLNLLETSGNHKKIEQHNKTKLLFPASPCSPLQVSDSFPDRRLDFLFQMKLLTIEKVDRWIHHLNADNIDDCFYFLFSTRFVPGRFVLILVFTKFTNS